MRDFKIQKLLFFVLLLGILAAGSALISPAHMNLKDRVEGRNRCAAGVISEPENTLDVLVLGDSLAYASVSPMELWDRQGIASYVCGQSGQNMTEAYYILKESLRTQSPRVVMLEVNSVFRYEGIFFELRTSMAEAVYDRLPILRYHDAWKSFVGKSRKPKPGYYKGYCMDGTVKPYHADDYMSKEGEEVRIAKWTMVYLENIRKLCEDHDIQLLLFSAPSPMNWNNQKHRVVLQYAKQHQLPYVDVNVSGVGPDMDWTKDTMDHGDHLNYYGSEKMSGFLASYLRENYDLPDHRGDSAYASWEDEAAIYRQDTAAYRQEDMEGRAGL